MEWLDEEWDGEIKEEKRKTEETANTKQKRRKLEPLVGWGDKLDNPATFIRTCIPGFQPGGRGRNRLEAESTITSANPSQS